MTGFQLAPGFYCAPTKSTIFRSTHVRVGCNQTNIGNLCLFLCISEGKTKFGHGSRGCAVSFYRMFAGGSFVVETVVGIGVQFG